MILSVGEILFDVFPGYRRVGGAPFNFAFHMKGLGFPVRFLSRVGEDPDGRELMGRLAEAGFDTRDIQADADHPTGRVNVELDDQGVPEFEILPNVAYDYLMVNPRIREILQGPIRLIYYGSLIQRTEAGFAAVQEILSQKPPGAVCLYDMNLRPGCFERRIIDASLRKANILKLNEEELETTAKVLGLPGKYPESVASMIERFDLSQVALTRGGDGSELFVGDSRYDIAPVSKGKIVDTVGAGDAYTSMLAAGWLMDWPPAKILSAASDFAARICSIEGAIPESSDLYYTVTADWKD
jgi:fructokinase